MYVVIKKRTALHTSHLKRFATLPSQYDYSKLTRFMGALSQKTLMSSTNCTAERSQFVLCLNRAVAKEYLSK